MTNPARDAGGHAHCCRKSEPWQWHHQLAALFVLFFAQAGLEIAAMALIIWNLQYARRQRAAALGA